MLPGTKFVRYMANEFKITDIVSKSALDQLDNLTSKFNSTAQSYSDMAKILAGGVQVEPKTIQELSDKSISYNKALTDLIKTQNKLSSLQEKQLNILNAIENRLTKLSSLTALPKLFEEFASNVKKASDALEAIGTKTERVSSSMESGSVSSHKYSQSMQEASSAISLTDEAYSKIIRTVLSYDEKAGQLNKKLTENKIRLEDIKKQLVILNKEYQKGTLSYQDYIEKSSILITNQRALNEENKQSALLLRDHAKVMISTAGSYDEMNAAVLQLERRLKSISKVERESASGQQLFKQYSALKDELLSIDAKMKNYQRNVGNYTSHWNGLSMSIQQVARELPSLAVGWNTFFLAISNNLPILVDELQKARVEFNKLSAANQKAVPVWKQVIGSIFSWQTLLVAGITILSMYGKEIIGWVSNLFKADNAVKDLLSSEQQMALARKKATENSIRERTELDLLYKKLKDNNTALDERKAAYNELIKKYPEYSGLMVDEKVDVKKLDDAYKSLSKQIIATARSRAYMDIITENEKKILDLEKKRLYQIYVISKAEEEYNSILEDRKKNNINAEIDSSVIAAAYNLKKQKDAYNEIVKLQDVYIKNSENIAKKIKLYDLHPQPKEGTKEYWENMKKEALSALDGIESKKLKVLKSGNSKEIEGLDKSIVDMYNNAMSKIKRADEELLVYQDQTNKQIEKYEKEKLQIQQAYQESELDLMDDGLEKELAKISFSYNKRIAAIKGNSEEEIATRENLAEQMQRELDKYEFEYNINKEKERIKLRLESVEEGSDKEYDLKMQLLVLERQMELNQDNITQEARLLILEKYEKKRNDLLQAHASKRIKYLQDTAAGGVAVLNSQMQDELNVLTESYTQGEIDKEEYERKKYEITERYAIKQMRNAIDLAKQQLEIPGLSPEDKLKLQQKLSEAEIALNEKVRDSEVKAAEDAENAWRKKLDSISEKIQIVGEILNSFSELSSAIFDRKIQEIEEEQEANEKAGDEEIARIERLEEVGVITKEDAEARKMAVEKETARKEEELAKKKAELQEKQAKWDKANSINQAIIATALGVTKALPDLVLAAIVSAMGAVQLATIVAQPIPKYAKGTVNHPGGLAIVGDGGKNEAILTDKGAYITPSVPTLVDIPQRAVVIPDIVNIDSFKYMRSDVEMLMRNADKKREPVTVNVNNDYSRLEKKTDSLITETRNLSKHLKNLSKNSEWHSIASRL